MPYWRRVLRGALCLGFLGVLLGGCDPRQGGDSADPACQRDPPLTWATFGQGYMTKHCLACHSSLLPESAREGAPMNIDFDTYGDVISWRDRIGARAVGDAADMPPGGGPSADERARLGEWLECQVEADAARVGP